MNGDVQTLTIGTVPYTIQVAVDRLAATLEGYAGWAIRVDLDPGVVLVATPAVDTDPTERRTGARQSDENPSKAPAVGPADSEGLDGRTA